MVLDRKVKLLSEFVVLTMIHRGRTGISRTRRYIALGFILVSIWILLGFGEATAFEVCGDTFDKKNRTNYCPSGNTCCRMSGRYEGDQIENDVESWGCIASDMGARNATCCSDNGNTGCPSGYNCRTYHDDSTGKYRHDCVRSNPSNDPFTKVLPRYQLCRAEDSNRKLYGLTVQARPRLPSNQKSTHQESSKIAYYSNQGPIDCKEEEEEECDLQASSQIQMALIVVHGANRNADDYFCSAKATIELQDRYPSSSVLVLAPLFLLKPRSESPSFLYWNDINDKDGSWRYGADSTGPTTTSSFSAMDAIIGSLNHSERFPNLQTIVVAGHSSGGQFVQRWSLLALSEVWPEVAGPIQMHAIVANPSSYAYLTPRRFLEHNHSTTTSSGVSTARMLRKQPNRVWKLPPNDDCQGYNQWEWGLDDGGDKDVPYKQQVIAREGRSKIVNRYLYDRSVVYMIGNLDRCTEGETNATIPTVSCDSHGLETTCADELQGSNRYERHIRYWNSLDRTNLPQEAPRRVSRQHKHRRVVVPNVGHDHSMMFQSAEGIDAIYNHDSESTLR